MKSKIFAIDPGTTESGFALVEQKGGQIVQVLDKGKMLNDALLALLPYRMRDCEIVCEMVASYGMPVGREVFETCVWIGRFLQAAGVFPAKQARMLVYRQEEKLTICHSPRANDASITQALVDRYAYGQPNHGKGTKKQPGFFHGFAHDAWQAFAVAVTWLEREWT